MTALRESRVIRAEACVEAGRDALARVQSLHWDQIGPFEVGALETALEIALTDMRDLIDELGELETAVVP
jgi:hypothetical protein